MKESRAYAVALLLVTGFLLTASFYYVNGVYLSRPYPYSTFLFLPGDRFNDFIHNYNISRHLNPYFEKYLFQSNYFPFANLFFFMTTLLPATGALSLYLLSFGCFMAWYSYHSLQGFPMPQRLLLTVIFSWLTYPFLSVIDRGNIEGLLFLFVALFLYCRNSDRTYFSSFFLAAAIAMKAFPGVFLVYLAVKRDFRSLLTTLGMVAGLTAISLFSFRTPLADNVHHILSGFNLASYPTFHSNNFVQSGIGFFTCIKTLLILGGVVHDVDFALLHHLYLAAVLLGFAALLCLDRQLPPEAEWQRLYLYVFAMLALPSTSCDYKLLYLLIPMFSFIRDHEENSLSRAICMIFGLLLIPKRFLVFSGIVSDSGTADIGLPILLNPLLMLLLLGIICLQHRTRLRAIGIPAGGHHDTA